ncbi:MAG TPA: alcohol dehydrogenase catalytic domain-containing protein [Blastocatellia bacterium]|nr:alcohol dehydrogenase catalytic domain-containing protein [Blastocatellia bacterium]
MKALRFDGNLKFVRNASAPQREGETLVRVICAGICNTDLEIVKGYSNFHGTPGHEFVGRVIESPDSSLVGERVVGEINAGCGVCGDCARGDSRHCVARTVLGIKGRDGAFAEFLSLPHRNLIRLPQAITDEAAIFVEPLSAALNILEQISVKPSDRIALIGDGKLAQLIVLALSDTVGSLSVIGRHPAKLQIAKEFGADQVCLENAARLPMNQRYDVVIEASGSPDGLTTALGMVRPRGTIVLKSTHHGLTSVDMSQVVVNEVTIVGSRCGRFQPAIEMLPKSQEKLLRLISQRFTLDEGLEAFEAASVAENMKVILQIDSGTGAHRSA